jgi:hypothetical protein
MKWGVKEQYKESIKQRVHWLWKVNKSHNFLAKLMKTHNEETHINKIKDEKGMIK